MAGPLRSLVMITMPICRENLSKASLLAEEEYSKIDIQIGFMKESST